MKIGGNTYVNNEGELVKRMPDGECFLLNYETEQLGQHMGKISLRELESIGKCNTVLSISGCSEIR